jgi:glycerophosphoryl diester phosphodiesterase
MPLLDPNVDLPLQARVGLTADSAFQTVWPYPSWIAHRGAGRLAPENTLAAFQVGLDHGFQMIEFDVQITADQIPVLMHDATLERTTNGQGPVWAATAGQIGHLDAGRWHSAAFEGEAVPTLAQVAQWMQLHGVLANLEIKPAQGLETQTGKQVASVAARLWSEVIPPLLSSFSVAALEAAKAVAPGLPRALLADVSRWTAAEAPFEAILRTALGLSAVAIVIQHAGLDADRIAAAHSAGLRVLTYTLNDAARAQALLSMGLDGVITDAVDCLGPGARSG